MKKVSEYGVHLTLIALARKYNVQFLAISSAGLPHCRIVSNDSKVDNERITLTLGHHYVSLEVESDTIDLIVYAIDEDNWVLGGQNAQPIESNGYEESVEQRLRSRLIEDSEDQEEDDQDHQYDLRGNKETPENPQNPENIQEDQLLTGPPYNREAENLRILSQQVQEKRNQPKVNRLVNEQRMQMRHLPPEIWTIIINMCLKNDPSLRFTLRYVCNTFCNIVDLKPFPQIYIAPEVLLRVPTPVSDYTCRETKWTCR